MTSANANPNQNNGARPQGGQPPPKADPQQTAMVAQERQKKEIQSLIDTVTLFNPDIKDRLTMASVWAFIQLPDSSFGWAGSTGQPMPMAAKMLSIAAHLQLGLQPGLGMLFFLGNNLYVSAKAARTKANSDPNWIYKKIEWKTHTPEE